MGYDKEIDYKAKMDEAVKAGDYESAAKYEKSRNEKIDGEKLPYEKTNNYAGWLDTTDYSNIIRDQIKTGASREKVSDTLKKRIKKSSGTIGLSQYTYDSVYDDAIQYIMGANYTYDEKSPVFENSYQYKVDKLYDELSRLKDFDYDLYSDDLYAYYKNQYNREGKRAMQDLLGELSLNTGGVASSYAVSAAAQMLENYNSKLTDKIPELYESAYDRYMDSVSSKRDNLKVLAGLAESEYEKYQDRLEQYNKDREFSYKNYLDSYNANYKQRESELNNESKNKELEYNNRNLDYLIDKLAKDDAYRWESLREDNKYRNDKLARDDSYRLKELQFKEKTLEEEIRQNLYDNEEKEAQQLVDNALEKWQTMGYLDSASAEILGLPEGLHTSDYDYKQAQQYKLYNN